MKTLACIALVVSAVAFLAGCGQDNRPSSATRVGVVDVARLQKELGVSDQASDLYNRAFLDLQSKLNEAIKPKLEEFTERHKALRAAIRKLPASQQDDQEEEVIENEAVVAAVRRLQNSRVDVQMIVTKYESALQGYLGNLNHAWQEALEPALASVAKEKGAQLILGKLILVKGGPSTWKTESFHPGSVGFSGGGGDRGDIELWPVQPFLELGDWPRAKLGESDASWSTNSELPILYTEGAGDLTAAVLEYFKAHPMPPLPPVPTEWEGL